MKSDLIKIIIDIKKTLESSFCLFFFSLLSRPDRQQQGENWNFRNWPVFQQHTHFHTHTYMHTHISSLVLINHCNNTLIVFSCCILVRVCVFCSSWICSFFVYVWFELKSARQQSDIPVVSCYMHEIMWRARIRFKNQKTKKVMIRLIES